MLDGSLKGLFVGGGVHVSSGTDGSSDSPLRRQGGYARVGNLNTYNFYGESRSFSLVARTGF